MEVLPRLEEILKQTFETRKTGPKMLKDLAHYLCCKDGTKPLLDIMQKMKIPPFDVDASCQSPRSLRACLNLREESDSESESQQVGASLPKTPEHEPRSDTTANANHCDSHSLLKDARWGT